MEPMRTGELLALDRCQFSGSLPDDFLAGGEVTTILLSGNQLQGLFGWGLLVLLAVTCRLRITHQAATMPEMKTRPKRLGQE